MLVRGVSRRNMTALVHGSRRSFTQYAGHLPPLPPLEEWGVKFPPGRTVDLGMIRPWLTNVRAQAKCLSQFGLADNDGVPKTVVEIYPGIGLLSRAILSLPRDRIKRLVIMEGGPLFLPYLEELAAADDRVVLIKRSGYEWDPYEEIKRNGTLDHIKPIHDGRIHPQLRLVSQLPLSTAIEQLVSQWIRGIPVRSWLWYYGRIPIHLFLDKWVHHRLTAPLGERHYGKLSVLSQAVCTISDLDPAIISPYDSYWYPRSRDSKLDGAGFRAKRPGHPMIACTLLPKPLDEIPIKGDKIDSWDFVLRSAFVLAKSPIKKALGSVAPGAAALLDKEGTRFIDPKKPVRALTVEEWTAILHAFDEWPFAPKTLVLPDSLTPRLGSGFLKDDDPH